ncbi:MAG: lytic transglycosylase domain-containing protein [Syntrophales bacterium]|nr:lytic transglycosylase domain-containing protein [Syntrophales bacterium]
MSVNQIDFKHFFSPVSYSAPSATTGNSSFSDIMKSVTAGNPSREEIETIAAYLKIRMNESLLNAIAGGDHVSPPTLFSGMPMGEMKTPPGPESKETGKTYSPDILNRAASTFHVDPSLISAVIKAESGGNPRATSPKGAIGLMQLMPGTAKDLGVTNAYDPEQNVMAGTKYLKILLDRYGGNRDLALAAYNWGPGNLEKSHRSMPRETVNYVARIKKYMGVQA